jgi:3-deoxy-manno-octulosonate cytidylyltransferase (CMP-KDO synthetase)
MMKTLVVIPARYGSTRLPRKVLLKETGKYLMQHTYEKVLKCELVDRIIIATDARRVFKAGREFGAEVKMTSKRHTCGTERVAEVAGDLPYQYIINVQADEPEIDPRAIDKIIITLQRNKNIDIATLVTPLKKNEIPDLNKVKALLDRGNFALEFVRYIPEPGGRKYYRHIGIYGYTKKAVLRFIKLPLSASENTLKLEQLRALENGIKIKAIIIKRPRGWGIDTKADYQDFKKRLTTPLKQVESRE